MKQNIVYVSKKKFNKKKLNLNLIEFDM